MLAVCSYIKCKPVFVWHKKTSTCDCVCVAQVNGTTYTPDTVECAMKRDTYNNKLYIGVKSRTSWPE